MNVSILTIDDGIFEVKSTAGNPNIGGEDFDNLLLEWSASVFENKNDLEIKSN